MAKLSRYTALIFGSSAGANQIAEFGSLAASAPQTYSGSTITPAIVQTLANYLTGWFGAVVGGNSPAIEDMNALCYLFAYQLAYIMQAGVAEWDSGTTYYTGSYANVAGQLYVSLVDNNTNNAPGSSPTFWRSSASNVVIINPSTQSPYALAAADQGKTFLIESNNAAMQFNLPAASANFSFSVLDRDGNFGTNNCTIHRAGSEKIQNVQADYVASAPYGRWNFLCDGTNWEF